MIGGIRPPGSLMTTGVGGRNGKLVFALGSLLLARLALSVGFSVD